MFGYLKSTFKDSVIYGLGGVAVKLSGLILIPLYTKYFSVSEYGLLGFLEATSIIIIAVFGLSLHQAFFVWYWDPHYADKQKSLFFTTLSSLGCIVTFLLLITILFSKPLSSLIFENSKYHRLLIFMVAASGLQILINMPAQLLRLQQKAVLYTIATILMLLINLAFIVVFIIVFKYGIEAIYISQTIGGIIYLLFLSPFIIKNLSRRFDRDILLKMLIFVFPLIISSIAALIISVSDRYILRFVSGYKNLGLYSFGAKLANTVNVLLLGPIQLAIYPILVKIFNTDKKERFYSKVMTYLCFFLLIFILFISFFSQEIVKILARNMEYWESFKIIPVLSFAAVFIMMKDLASFHLQLTGKTKLLSVIIVSVSLLNILLNLLLIPLFNYIGAAFSFLISQIIYFLLLHYFANKQYVIGYEYRKILLMVFLSAFLIFLSFIFSHSTLIIRIAGKILLLLVFPVSLYFSNFFEKVELQRISDIWRDWKNPGKWGTNLKRLIK